MRALVASLAGLLAGPLPALADDDADVVAARKFAEPVMGATCDFKTDMAGKPEGFNNVHQLTWRDKGQDQDSPDHKLVLVQLECGTGAYNYSSIYVTRDGDGKWEIVTFAEPVAEYDYADEHFSKLRAPPEISGFVTTNVLVNSEYSVQTGSIAAAATWRGIGDASSGGEWQFVTGRFVLKRFWMDPTFQAPGGEEDPNAPASYTLYDTTAPDKWMPSTPEKE